MRERIATASSSPQRQTNSNVAAKLELKSAVDGDGVLRSLENLRVFVAAVVVGHAHCLA